MTTEALGRQPRIRRRTWILLILGGVILVAACWAALGGPGWQESALPQPPPIPIPNGYDDAVEAGRAIEKSGLTGAKFDLDKMDKAALEPVVHGTREAVADGRKSLEKPFQVPVVYDLNSMMNVMMKDLGAIRGGLVRAMLAQGKLAAMEGRIDEAAGCCADVIRLGTAMSHGVPMIAYLVSVAAQTSGLHHLRDLRGKLSPEECRKMIALLEETDAQSEVTADVTQRETMFMNANLKKLGFFAGISMRVSGIHAKGLRQVASSLATAEKRLAASRRVLLADLAIRVYRQEHGEDPPDLNALVPTILKSVPLDPYNKKPLRYVKRGKDGVVYSVGPDRDDDNLSKPLPLRHNDTTDGDFTIDSL